MPVFPVPCTLTLGAALALMAPVVPLQAEPAHLPAISVEGANADDPF